MGLHPPITAGHTQPAPMPLLTAKSLYDNTLPEVWFATEETARANGFVKAPE